MKRSSLAITLLVLCLPLLGAPAAAQEPPEPSPAAVPELEPAGTPAADPRAADPESSDPQTAAAPTGEPQTGEPQTGEPGAAADPEAPAPLDPMNRAAGAVQTGATEVADQGRELWSETLVPMGKRFAAAIVPALKALLILLIFWIVAIALSSLVRKLLGYTNLDEKAARDWGLGGLLEKPDGERRSIASLAATAVKWLILLFGFVAFFDALQLGMVAAPLQNILQKITEVLPALLQALVILIAYWIVATLLKIGATRGLEAAGFDRRAEKYLAPREIKGERVGPSGLIGRLLFYVVLLFAIPPFLDALGQQSLVAPLRDMLAKALEFLPNLVAAAILLFIGRIVATIVREVVSNFLAAAGADAFAERFGLGEAKGTRRLSEIAGAVAFFFTLVPILVAAVDTLQIKAISDPVKNTLQQLLAAVPLLFVAVVVVAIGYFIAKAVRGLVESFLSGVGFDALPAKLGLGFLDPKEGSASLSSIGGTVVMVIILLLTAEQALATLHLDELSTLVGGLLAYLPRLFVGLVIILAALSLGGYVARLVADAMGAAPYASVVSTVARYAIVFLGFSMGLSQLGVGREIVMVAVSAVLGGSALALGLAFGLGGRDRAKQIIEQDRTGSG